MAMFRKIFTKATLVHGTGGAVGAIASMTVMYPLDQIRHRMQLEDESVAGKTALQAGLHILKTEGLGGLYRGMRPALISIGVTSFVYFYAFHGLKSLKLTRFGNSDQTDLILSSAAGIVDVFVTNPLWVVNSRLKMSNELPYTSLTGGIRHVASTEGIKSLWSGLGASLLLVANPAINFTLYEALKRRFPCKHALGFFLMGAASKAVATTATYPLQLAQARQRYSGDTTSNTAALLMDIVKKNGFTGLYQGFEVKMLQTTLSAALMFMTYEQIAQFVFMLMVNHKSKMQRLAKMASRR